MNDQLALWKTGRDEDGNVVGKVVTNARPGSSFHNFGLAVDSCFIGADPYWEKLIDRDEAERRWSEFCRFVKLHGLESGGDFTLVDRPHAQCRYGLSLKEAQNLYKLGGLESVWKKCDSLIQGG